MHLGFKESEEGRQEHSIWNTEQELGEKKPELAKIQKTGVTYVLRCNCM